jgi:predicted DNA-binding transcriptional regulator YafY
MADPMALLAQAWKECRILRILYPDRTRRSHSGERKIEVYAFDDLYIDARCIQRDDRRTFRIDRILDIELLDQKFHRDSEFEARVRVEGWAKTRFAQHPSAVRVAPPPPPPPSPWRRILLLLGIVD